MYDGSGNTDSELYHRARLGDQSAFGDLVERHKNGLVNYLTRLSVIPEKAEDMAQEAFLRLYERGGQYREQGKLQAYLFRIGTNLFRSQRRREQRWQRIGLLFFNSNGHHTEPSQQRRVLMDEMGKELSTALLRLPLRYRAPLILSFIEGWTHREIAKVMRCQEGTVKSRIHRGKKLLKTQLAEYRNGDSP